MQTMPRQQRI